MSKAKRADTVNLRRNEDLNSDILQNSTLFKKEVKKIMPARLEHYFWFHNRWNK